MTFSFSTKAVAAIAGVAMLSTTMSAPASAFTLASPSIGEQFSTHGQVDKVWWCRWGRCGYGWGWRGYGWRGYGWGWRGYGWRRCWRCW